MVCLLSVVMDDCVPGNFLFQKGAALSGFPCRVYDCEGASRFPWASSPVTGSYTRATGVLGRFSGWPSAVLLSSLLSPRSHGGGARVKAGAQPHPDRSGGRWP